MGILLIYYPSLTIEIAKACGVLHANNAITKRRSLLRVKFFKFISINNKVYYI